MPQDGRLDAAALFRAHAPFVAGFLRRLGVGADDVDDLVQEVFLVAHQKGGYVPGPARPRSWLGAIALRLARGYRRARGRNREDADALALELSAGDGKSPAETLELRRSLQRVQSALDGLDLEHRAAFILYELEGESCAAIAASLEVPVGTVYSRLHHARKKFLQAYEAQGAEEGAAAGVPLAEGA
ncbi:MAG: RNA polymerase sigma factor [Myxococcales bacterium]|jgi:RNA polymerase sigma-70 factor (ECF subfamily)